MEAPFTPLNLKAQYRFGMAGVQFGRVGVEISQSPARYEAVSDVESTGIVKFFVKHSSHTTSSGKGADFLYPDVEYESNYQTRKKRKSAKSVKRDGKMTELKVQPPEDGGKRPPVEQALRDDAIDPLALGLFMRKGLYDALKSGKSNYSTTMFDGRRLTQVNFQVAGDANIAYRGEQTPVLQVNLSRKLLGGYSQSELEEAAKKKDPPVHVYFTRDERLLPIVFEMPMWFGTARAELVKECKADTTCLLGNLE